MKHSVERIVVIYSLHKTREATYKGDSQDLRIQQGRNETGQLITNTSSRFYIEHSSLQAIELINVLRLPNIDCGIVELLNRTLYEHFMRVLQFITEDPRIPKWEKRDWMRSHCFLPPCSGPLFYRHRSLCGTESKANSSPPRQYCFRRNHNRFGGIEGPY